MTFNLSYDESTNPFSGPALDGHAVYRFILWIEPMIHPSADIEGDARGPLTRARRELRVTATDDVAMVPVGASAILVGGVRGGQIVATADCTSQHRRDVAGAIELIDAAGLAFYPELALGAIVFGDGDDGFPALPECDVIAAPARAAPRDLAAQILRGAAASFFRHWVRVETAAGVDDLARLPTAEVAWAEALLCDSVEAELWRRLSGSGCGEPSDADRHGDLRARLGQYQEGLFERVHDTFGVTTLSELLCVSYPLWTRRQFSGSPSNNIRVLRPFTDEERTSYLERFRAR